MRYEIILNPTLLEREILDLLEATGQEKENGPCRRHCPFWAGVQNDEGHGVFSNNKLNAWIYKRAARSSSLSRSNGSGRAV